jgi:predicted ATPase/Tfp pilus assembly protein PilF
MRCGVPTPLTRLIGRESALARLEALLRSDRRLVTLIGAPGIGKTRVALELGRRFAGSRFCDLAQVRTAEELARAVADVDDVRAAGQQLAAAGESLLIADNLEQSVDVAASVLADWLAAAPGLRCLATSRERLRIPGEVVYELEPLSEAAAVQLFVERAREGFALCDAEHDTVVQIARALDGVPLAIELAAAQMVVLSPAALLARLDQRLLLLDGGSRGAPARHASLRAAVEWSWNLLDAAERSALTACAVFRAGFSLEAAEAIVAQESLVNVLRSLCDRSLLRREADAFRLLSNVAAYARERLDARVDRAALFERHADFHLALALRERSAWPAFVFENLIAVVQRGVQHAPGVTLAHALNALTCLAEPSLLAEFDRALELAREDPHLPRDLLARARLARGRLRLQKGLSALAVAEFRSVADTTCDAALRADAWFAIGHAERREGQPTEAERSYRRAHADAAERGDTPAQARILTSLAALLYEQQQIAGARDMHARALSLYRELGDTRGAAIVLQNSGLIAQEQGHLDEAEAIFDEALKQHVQLGHRRFEGVARLDLAGLAFERGLPQMARAHAETALAVLLAESEPRLAALALALRGACAAALGGLDAAHRDLEQAGADLVVIEDRVFADVVAIQRGHLELARALQAYARGHDRTSSEHITRARELTQRVAHSGESDERRLAERVLHNAIARHDRLAQALCVASDHGWLRAPERERVELGTKKVLRRILAALIDRRLSSRASPLSAADLIRLGWPDQRLARSAAANRLQVALSQLRRAGLERILLRRPEGYLLDPELVVLVIDQRRDADEGA